MGIGTSIFIDVWAASNHFSSTPDGRVFQRREQAAYMAAIVDAIETDDPGARVIVDNGQPMTGRYVFCLNNGCMPIMR